MAKKAARPELRVVVDNSAERADAESAVTEKHAESPEQVEMPFASA